MDERYELCVIGAGTAGFAAAQTARAAGRRVLLVSGPGDLGGTCILRGCMPAKTLLSSTERAGEVESAEGVGVETAGAHVDVGAVIARKRELVEYFAEDRLADLAEYPLLRGCARFTGRNSIEVDGREIAADRFIIATGSHIVRPPISGLADIGYLISDDVLELTAIPASIGVIGGGPVGCEFAQYFARLGTRVTLLQDGPHVLRNEDPDIGAAVTAALKADAVDVVLDAVVERAARSGNDTVLSYTTGGALASVHVERVLLATGRVPKIDGLGVETAGVLAADGRLAVDPYLRTTNADIFAAGDVIGRRCLVHVAAYTGKLAATNAFADHPRVADFDRFEVHAVYTQPQVAVAGLTERTCAERGIPVRVARHPFSDIGKALVSNDTAGFVKMIAERDGRIAGVAIVGGEAIDLIGEAVALIDRGATVTDVAEMPHLHPTMGEILGRVAEDLAGGTEPVAA